MAKAKSKRGKHVRRTARKTRKTSRRKLQSKSHKPLRKLSRKPNRKFKFRRKAQITYRGKKRVPRYFQRTTIKSRAEATRVRSGVSYKKVQVFVSRFKKELFLKRRTFIFKPARPLNNENINLLNEKAREFYFKAGPAYKNLFLVKILYKFKVNGYLVESAFSFAYTEVKNERQFEDHLQDTWIKFFELLETYLTTGFLLNGIMLQTYVEK